MRYLHLPATLLISFALLSAGASADEKIKVIIDTDVAMGYKFHDVDDGLMLLLALNSPERVIDEEAFWEWFHARI